MREHYHGKINRRTALKALGVGTISSFAFPTASTVTSAAVGDVVFEDNFEDGVFDWTDLDHPEFWSETGGQVHYNPSSSSGDIGDNWAYADETYNGDEGLLDWPVALEVKGYATDTSAGLGGFISFDGLKKDRSPIVMGVQDSAYTGGGDHFLVWNTEQSFKIGTARQNDRWYTYRLVPDLEEGVIHVFRNGEHYTIPEPRNEPIEGVSVVLGGGTCWGCGGTGTRRYEYISVDNISSNGQSVNRTWLQYQFDSSKTGHNQSAPTITGGITHLWRKSVGGSWFQLGITTDTIYSGGPNGLTAINRSTKETKWRVSPSGVTSPTLVDDTVYVGALDDGNIFAFNATTGDSQWTFSSGNERGFSSPTPVEDSLYTHDGSFVYSLNAATGEQQWRTKPDSPSTHPLLRYPIAVTDGTVYVTRVDAFEDSGGNTAKVISLAADTGVEENGFIPAEDGIWGSPVVLNGTLFFGGYEDIPGTIYALDSQTFDILWKRPVEGRFPEIAVAGGTVFVAAQGTSGDNTTTKVYAIDAGNGDLVWPSPFELPAGDISLPIVAGDNVYFSYLSSENPGTLFALNVTSGEKQWKETFDEGLEHLRTSPTAVDNNVYVAGSSDLYALEGETGEEEVSLELDDVRPVQTAERTRLVGSDIEIDAPETPDLVAYKDTAMLFDLEGNVDPIPDEEKIEFESKQHLDTGETISRSFELSAANIKSLVDDESDPLLIFDGAQIDVFHGPLESLQPNVETLSVEINPLDDFPGIEDSYEITIGDDIEVKFIDWMDVGFIEIKDPDDGGNYGHPETGRLWPEDADTISPEDLEPATRERFKDLVSETTDYLEMNFPVPGGISTHIHPEVMEGTDGSLFSNFRDDLKDARDDLEDNFEDVDFDVTIAIVPDDGNEDDVQDYFEFHNNGGKVGFHIVGDRGYHPQASAAAMANVKRFDAIAGREVPYFDELAAHEAGHHFLGHDADCTTKWDTGLYPDNMAMRRPDNACDEDTDSIDNAHARTKNRVLNGEEDDPPGIVSTAFDLSNGVFDSPSIRDTDLADPIVYNSSFMSNAFPFTWIDTFAYQEMLERELSPHPPEEENLFEPEPCISGSAVVDEDDEVRITSIRKRQGRPMPSAEGGNVTIDIQDPNDNILDSRTYSDALRVTYLDEDMSSGTTLEDQFLFVIPFPETTAKVRTELEGVVTTMNPVERSVRDRIEQIPDYGFINRPDERRDSLFNKLDAIDEQMKQDGFRSARQQMEDDVRANLERWLEEEYETTALQPTKQEMLELVDDMINRLATLAETSNPK